MNESITWNRYLIGQVPQLFVAGKLQNISSEHKDEASVREETGSSFGLEMGNLTDYGYISHEISILWGSIVLNSLPYLSLAWN